MAKRISGVVKDLDGFQVTRILPNFDKKMVGPFIFFDHMGPAEFAPGDGINVRPHPHIGLSTITYMLEGGLLHRDSLGNCLEVLPGDVNWMTAGCGIVHSERETIEVKAKRHNLNGIQCWLALPEEHAEVDPCFSHIKKFDLPHFIKDGALMRLIAGEAYGMTSPITTYSPMFYLDVMLEQHNIIHPPHKNHETALYILQGSVEIGEEFYEPGDFVLVGATEAVRSLNNSRFLMIGGEPWPKAPHIHWNFVSFSRERIEQAKNDWRNQKFPEVPGDNAEYTPLP